MALDIAAIAGVWVALPLLTKPTGEFPLNDDWSYARSVQTLLTAGRLELTGFTAMPLVTQVAWGWLFSLPAGFSFTALRVSTWLVGAVGLFATYAWLSRLRSRHAVVLVG